MDYLPPPPPAIEMKLPITHEQLGILTISVHHAKYNKTAQKAVLDLTGALKKSHKIMNHRGTKIALIYQGKMNEHDVQNCPDVRIPYTDIARDINFLKNTVTLTISNIGKNLADKITASHCLKIDTNIVKKVVNPSYDETPSKNLNR